ncbi:cell division protein FtsX [Desulfocicer vacuolatum DSM 3385]|uniref:Cell division protein FtsX n=1 Tax=Desulfocicer vacuolatum DSM 3385 TaxID=1121400 RepID=A0A1W1YPN5_9BACT|nr:permease-like cell division protein FtsX [Desulfocicer vacuolatum]SMC37771.1 cell division protein FtsX [Desulfocicer vacuolatum DSM 3385]
MRSYVKRALENMAANVFLTATTLFTIALSVLIAGAFFLFFENAARLAGDWNRGIRVMAYLDERFTPRDLAGVTRDLRSIEGVKDIRFVSKETALEQLQKDLESSGVTLSDLGENPLPHTLEILLSPSLDTLDAVEAFVESAGQRAHVKEVVYGHGWVAAFLPMVNTLKTGALVLGGLFVITALFVSANTVRLAFYAKQEEIEIMRLVGATEAFVNTPFYLEGIFQGFCGGSVGLVILFFLFQGIRGAIPPEASLVPLMDIQFLSFPMMALIVGAGIFLGWLGCFISLKSN